MDHGWYLIRNRRFLVKYHFFYKKYREVLCVKGERSEKGVTVRIESSYIGMDSTRSYTSVSKKTSSLKSRTYIGTLDRREGSLNFQGALLGGNKEENTKAENTNAETATETQTGGEEGLSLQNRFRSTGITKISNRTELEVLDKIRQQCITYLLELFGLKDRDEKSDDLTKMTDVSETTGGVQTLDGTTLKTTVLSANYTETYMEQETTSFATKCSVVTADGRRMDFQLELEMSRSFQTTYEQSYELLYQRAEFCDPLVINLDTDIASVSDQKFLFDIDADGVLDTISQLNAGSGYLAIDKNNDGRINDGSELFGAQSGNGFADLAQYDDDGNGWIDEGDAIWDKLLIWCKDENGKDKLYHVSEKGVGAICLQNQATDFSLNSLKNNQTNAQIRRTGIFLYENGTMGTLQHVDMAKQ